MEVALRRKSEVWRTRGRPRREVPPEIAELADQTYKTNQCGVVTLEASDTDQDIRDLMNVLVSYARSKGKRIVRQDENGEFRFVMVDDNRKRK